MTHLLRHIGVRFFYVHGEEIYYIEKTTFIFVQIIIFSITASFLGNSFPKQRQGIQEIVLTSYC